MTLGNSRDLGVWIGVSALCISTLILDWMTSLGYAEWCFYFIAVGLTLFQGKALVPFLAAAISTSFVVLGAKLSATGLDTKFAYTNRAIGVLSFWTMAVVVAHAIRVRGDAALVLWLQASENELSIKIRGEQSPALIAQNGLRLLCEKVGAPVAVFYSLQGDTLKFVGGYATPANIKLNIPVSEGVMGEAVQTNTVKHLRALNSAHVTVDSAFGTSRPSEVLIAPVTAEGDVIGVIELGRLQPLASEFSAEALLRQSAETLGIAMRGAFVRQQLADLLEETQRQGAELQAQQEELRVSNEELEEQSKALQEAQVILENQQAELEQSNVQLEERTQELELEKEAVVASRNALAKNAAALASASRYKTEFLANMSHELRTPLNSSLILAKLLTDNKAGTLTGEQVKYAKAIYDSNTDLLTLINDILDLSRIEAGHVELVAEHIELSTLLARLEETFNPLAQQKEIALDFEVKCAPENLITDSQRLQQILTNLLANSIKFTETGRVRLLVEPNEHDGVSFTVTDTGIGIAEEQLENIFEAFRQADGSTRRKYGGSGLGLSISRDLAQRMGGSLSVSSEVGRGSAFRLDLPAEIPPDADLPATSIEVPDLPGSDMKPSGSRPPERKARPILVDDDRFSRTRGHRLILAVEDDASFAEALVALAHEMDFDCIVASDTSEALVLANEYSPRGVLLDLGLPDGSGLTVLERLKRDPATRHIPVHVVSGMEKDQRALELGAVGYLRKPVTRENLQEAMRQLEEMSQREVRRLLIVEDDSSLRESLQLLLAREDLEIFAVGSVADASTALFEGTFDCVVMDLALSDGSGYDLLEQMSLEEPASLPPVIVYTGRTLNKDDEQRLRRYSKSIILKGARSPERLLDEVTLFLHSVEASLPSNQQRLLQEARRRDAILDGRTILLAEDDVRNIFALSSILEPLGVHLELARNGREALERLAVKEVDLVLMDIMMPEMDGYEAMRQIRLNPAWKDIPIIALTAKAMTDDRARCLEAGASDYIAKPIDVDKLVSLCRVWCAGR